MQKPTPPLRIAVAQINLLVGDIEANAQRVIDWALHAADKLQAELIVFPELTLTSYPPEDLLLRPALYSRLQQALDKIAQQLADSQIAVIIGYPAQQQNKIYNRLALIAHGKIEITYDKQRLPNYGVFDEKRYFTPGEQICIVNYKQHRLGLLICEDLWYQHTVAAVVAQTVDAIISINASPFNYYKSEQRQQIALQLAAQYQCPILYVNLVGGQDQLVFDGGSFAVHPETDKQAVLAWQAHYFREQSACLSLDTNPKRAVWQPPPKAILAETAPDLETRVYQALVLATRDYIQKNNFCGALLGLSGGIDSALALAIVVDAIGPDAVTAVMMPSRYTREISLQDAASLASNLQVDYQVIDIDPLFSTFMDCLNPYLTQSNCSNPASAQQDTTAENLQARCRGNVLMALSNNTGKLVIACGNKSEMAVGYATLYGDMVGGYAMLKDVPKTMVYRLARYRNRMQATIPERIIEREPSAELSAEQVDRDSLPPYSELDAILEQYIEYNQSPQQIIDLGYAADTVKRIIRMVNHNEYKRRQAAPGVCISNRAFDKERRYPITNGYYQLQTHDEGINEDSV